MLWLKFAGMIGETAFSRNQEEGEKTASRMALRHYALGFYPLLLLNIPVWKRAKGRMVS